MNGLYADCVNCGEETISTAAATGIELCAGCWNNNVASQYRGDDGEYNVETEAEPDANEPSQSGIADFA